MYRACPSYKSFPFLTERETKGYNFEMQIQNLLNGLNVEYEGNPTNVEQWKRKIESGYDIKVFTKKKILAVECKFNLSRSYPSYILRDVYPRFFKCNGNEKRIVVTNDKGMYNENCRIALYSFDITLMDTTDFYNYIISMNSVTNTMYLIKFLYYRIFNLIVDFVLSRAVIPRTKLKLFTFGSKFRRFVRGLHSSLRLNDSSSLFRKLKVKLKKKITEVKEKNVLHLKIKNDKR